MGRRWTRPTCLSRAGFARVRRGIEWVTRRGASRHAATPAFRKDHPMATKDVPGNQTPNTAEVNEKAIARLTVDQLRGRLRRRGITDTGDMKKDNLVQALVKALREGRKTTRSRSGSTPGGRRDDAADRDVTGASEGRPDSPQEVELPEVEPRAAELESVPPQADALEDVERRAA